MRVLLLGSHSILEHDDLAMWHALGHEVASIGGYIVPRSPHDPKRPALDIDPVDVVKRAVDALGQPHPDRPRHLHSVTGQPNGQCSEGHIDTLAAAKMWLPDAILEWAEVIIVSAFEREWLLPQWHRFKQRVIWRTIGQSGDANERAMAPLVSQGLEIVRYSPKERNIPGYAGENAVIRFYKDPAEWQGWTGEDAVVTNVTQAMFDRHPWCNPAFWALATEGLPVRPMGERSEIYGGVGEVSYEAMKEGLRRARCYLYTGTQPASYTLGLIEATMTGCPVVSIGPSHMKILPYGPDLFEGHEIAYFAYDDPQKARSELSILLFDKGFASLISGRVRENAIRLFGKETIFRQWAGYLAPVREAVAA